MLFFLNFILKFSFSSIIPSNDYYGLKYISGENFFHDLNLLNYSQIEITESTTIDISGKIISVYASKYLNLKIISKSLGVLILNQGYGCILDIYGPSIIQSLSNSVTFYANVDNSKNIVPYIEFSGSDSYIYFTSFSLLKSFWQVKYLCSYAVGRPSGVYLISWLFTTNYESPILTHHYYLVGYDVQISRGGFDKDYIAINYQPWIGHLMILIGILLISFIIFIIYNYCCKNKNKDYDPLDSMK